jgi:multimeric flavodoxin WrbA
MNIVAVYGSPAKLGNSALITNAVLSGAADNGHTASRIYLHELDVKNCLACENATTIHADRDCIHDDDMTKRIIPALEKSDILILSSPVYMGHITGITKTFIDRWYTFILSDSKIRILPGKKFVTIVTSGASAGTFQNVTEYLDNWLSNFFKMIKIKQIHEGNLMESGMVKNRKELLKRAYEIGKNIN